MEINFKKIFIWLAVIIGSCVYVYKHYTFQDVLACDNKYRSWVWGPRVDYYIGVGLYLKDRHEDAAAAFEQLLTNYPTCQYAPAALYKAGVAYQNLRQWEKARAAYQRYLELFPQGPQAELANKKYEYIKFR